MSNDILTFLLYYLGLSVLHAKTDKLKPLNSSEFAYKTLNLKVVLDTDSFLLDTTTLGFWGRAINIFKIWMNAF